MIILRSFNTGDISVLREYVLKGYSDNELLKTIGEWDTKRFNGKYFEMFAVCLDDSVIGSVSLYQHDCDTISIGPEIFPAFRRKGYASLMMEQALMYAKRLGYKTGVAQIRKNNIASIRLHEKCGFAFNSETVNRNGNEVFIYSRMI